MDKNYVQPSLEAIEIAPEQAILGASDFKHPFGDSNVDDDDR